MDRFLRKNEIVTDNENNLMWQDDTRVNKRVTWKEAVNNLQNFSLGGFTDWRLPSIDELLSIANKNSSPNLDKSFQNRPFTTWSSFADEKNEFIKAVFYNEEAVSLMNIDEFHFSIELFARYVRDLDKKDEIKERSTNIINLTCNCKNWKLTRKKFLQEDPRRLCKHIIQALDIENIQSDLKRYREDILFYKKQKKGFPDNFTSIINIDNTTYKLLYKKDFDWMNLYDINSMKYGVLLTIDGEVYWAKKNGKPENYKIVEDFLKSDYNKKISKIPHYLTKEEIKCLINFIKQSIPGKEKSYFTINEDQYEPTEKGIYYYATESSVDPYKTSKLIEEFEINPNHTDEEIDIFYKQLSEKEIANIDLFNEITHIIVGHVDIKIEMDQGEEFRCNRKELIDKYTNTHN